MNSMSRALIVVFFACNTFAMEMDHHPQIQEMRKRSNGVRDRIFSNHIDFRKAQVTEKITPDKQFREISISCNIGPKKQSIDHKYASIYEAVKADDIKGIESFLGTVDINEYNEDGDTPLHCAVDFFAASAIKLLILMGADLDKKDKDGKYSPSQLAEQYNDESPFQNPVAWRAIQDARAETVRKEGGVLIKLAPLKEFFEKYAQGDSAPLTDSTEKQTVLRRSARIKKFLEKRRK